MWSNGGWIKVLGREGSLVKEVGGVSCCISDIGCSRNDGIDKAICQNREKDPGMEEG